MLTVDCVTLQSRAIGTTRAAHRNVFHCRRVLVIVWVRANLWGVQCRVPPFILIRVVRGSIVLRGTASVV
jgi:hypothetical protein